MVSAKRGSSEASLCISIHYFSRCWASRWWDSFFGNQNLFYGDDLSISKAEGWLAMQGSAALEVGCHLLPSTCVKFVEGAESSGVPSQPCMQGVAGDPLLDGSLAGSGRSISNARGLSGG